MTTFRPHGIAREQPPVVARRIRQSDVLTSARRFRRRSLVRNVPSRLLIDGAHRKLDLAAIVDADQLDLDAISDLHHVGDLSYPFAGEFADVHQSVAIAQEVHEGAEVDDLYHLARVDDPDLRF